MTKILAIETSCDETAAAVIGGGRTILSNVVATQIELHRRYGGVFPEVASRQHVLAIQPVIEEALHKAGLHGLGELDAIAVTQGPGLAGSLLVGVNAAKGMSFASGLPLLGVNHLEGHIYSNWIDAASGVAEGNRTVVDETHFPLLILIISGGHTELVLMRGHGCYEHLGGTIDDAAGEAFDKVARLLELGFPGGPAIQRAAESGDPLRFDLPRPLSHHAEHRLNFSFSGLKTAVLNLTKRLDRDGADLTDPALKADLAASFQAAVVEVLATKLSLAAADCGVQTICICGGVSANRALRQAVTERCNELGIAVHIPPLHLCTDNAAMIGAAAHFRFYESGVKQRPWDEMLALDVNPNLPLVQDVENP